MIKEIYMEQTINYLSQLCQASGDPGNIINLQAMIKTGEIKKVENGPTYLVITHEDLVITHEEKQEENATTGI